MITGAIISEDKKYRYQLWRIWDDEKPKCLFVMLNPSTADASKDDATIRRCIAFAKSWGYGGIYVGNNFPYRATNPKELLNKPFSEIAPTENIKHLNEMSSKCEMHILAYGNIPVKDCEPLHIDERWHYLKLTKAGNPCHPLYLKQDLKPIKFPTS